MAITARSVGCGPGRAVRPSSYLKLNRRSHHGQTVNPEAHRFPRILEVELEQLTNWISGIILSHFITISPLRHLGCS